MSLKAKFDLSKRIFVPYIYKEDMTKTEKSGAIIFITSYI